MGVPDGAARDSVSSRLRGCVRRDTSLWISAVKRAASGSRSGEFAVSDVSCCCTVAICWSTVLRSEASAASCCALTSVFSDWATALASLLASLGVGPWLVIVRNPTSVLADALVRAAAVPSLILSPLFTIARTSTG